MDWRGVRVLIGAGSFTDAAAALHIASRLTENMIGQLGGLLIEEGDVTAVCRLPNQRVISTSGAVVMAPSPTQIRTLMKADAQAFRKMLADVAKPSAAKWTFEQRSGDLFECSIDVGRTWDVLIVGHRELHPVRGNVVFLGSPSAQQDAALNLSMTLAAQLHTGLVVFSFSQAEVDAPRTRTLHFDELRLALSQLARVNAQVVVIDLKRGPIRTKAELRDLLDMARCPVVVLGASALEPALEHNIQMPPTQNHDPQ